MLQLIFEGFLSYRNGPRPIHFKDMRNTMLFLLSGPIGQVNPELNEKSYHVDEPSARILADWSMANLSNKSHSYYSSC